jgi:hypothetical protein
MTIQQPEEGRAPRNDREVVIMSIVILIAIGIALLLILAFFAVNGWSSFARDREKSAALRNNRQMPGQSTESRGTGIN